MGEALATRAWLLNSYLQNPHEGQSQSPRASAISELLQRNGGGGPQASHNSIQERPVSSKMEGRKDT